MRATAVPLRCRRLPALFLLCLLPGGRNLGLVFSNSLKAAIPWTRRRSAGAASASSPPSPEEGRESACRTSTTSQAAPRERAASPSRKGPSLRGSRSPTAKRRDKSNTRRRRCATDRDMAHGVFHSKGDRPRGGTRGLRIRLCHHDLHDRKHPGAPARPVPRRRGPDRHLLHLSVLRRGVPRLHAPALLPDDVRRAPGRARLLAPPLPALGALRAGGPCCGRSPRHPAHPAPQQTSICRKTRGR